ncbi:MAG: hypothetical protein PHO02_00475 [Candidatus Nanoarchaeia archaeon]|nr:hypothetical protein [Candidatus Nanoarchaeia archaeon]
MRKMRAQRAKRSSRQGIKRTAKAKKENSVPLEGLFEGKMSLRPVRKSQE